MLTNLRMDRSSVRSTESTSYIVMGRPGRAHAGPRGAYVGQWLQSFREFPPRMKPGSFSLDRVMEAVTSPQGGK